MSLVELLNRRGDGTLPGLIGLEILEAGAGALAARLELRNELMAPNGYLHAATVVALADTACGYGTFASLPEGAQGFTTVELKTNFLGTRRSGALRGGRPALTAVARRRSGTLPSPARRTESPQRSSAARS